MGERENKGRDEQTFEGNESHDASTRVCERERARERESRQFRADGFFLN